MKRVRYLSYLEPYSTVGTNESIQTKPSKRAKGDFVTNISSNDDENSIGAGCEATEQESNANTNAGIPPQNINATGDSRSKSTTQENINVDIPVGNLNPAGQCNSRSGK